MPPHLPSCRPILHICYFTQANLQGVYFIAAQDMPALSHRTLISVGTSRDCFGAQDSSTSTLRLRMRGAFTSTVPHTSSNCGGWLNRNQLHFYRPTPARLDAIHRVVLIICSKPINVPVEHNVYFQPTTTCFGFPLGHYQV